jgi:uncharacterized membrane protein YfcA
MSNQHGGTIAAWPAVRRKNTTRAWSGALPFGRICFVALAVWTLIASAELLAPIIGQREGAWLSAAIAAILLFSALVSGIAGFAFSALAGSALAYLEIDRLHAVQTMVVCSIATQLYAVWKIRDSIRWISVWPMILAGAVTIPLGVLLLVHVDGSGYAAGLGAFIACYACYVLLRREPRVVSGSVWHDAVAGALGGLAGGFAGFPGSFVTIWCSMRGWDKLQQRAVYQPYILAMQIVTIVCLRSIAPSHDVAEGLIFVPFALLGAIAGLAVFQRLTNRQFQIAVGLLLAVSGTGLLARAF